MKKGKSKQSFTRFIIKYWISVVLVAFIISLTSIRGNDRGFGEHYIMDATFPETVDFFLQLRDSLYRNADDSLKREFANMQPLDSIRNSMRYEFFYMPQQYCWRVYLPFYFNDDYHWIQVLIYPESIKSKYLDVDNETRVIFISVGKCDSYIHNYTYVNSSSLGFWRSFFLSRKFENEFLRKSNFTWKDVTPIDTRLGPLYSWTYNIYEKENRKKY